MFLYGENAIFIEFILLTWEIFSRKFESAVKMKKSAFFLSSKERPSGSTPLLPVIYTTMREKERRH